MTISMYSAFIPATTKVLGNLEGILDKAAAHQAAKKIADAAFVDARLFPDMFPFSLQVRIAGDMVKGGAARLAGVELVRYEDNEKTLAELKARVQRTREYLQTFKPEQIDGTEAKAIVFTLGGKERKFTGIDYLNHWVLPNFYFHVTTAYNLLRQGGVEIGKMDYLGQVG
jgi:hypothetical protein